MKQLILKYHTKMRISINETWKKNMRKPPNWWSSYPYSCDPVDRDSTDRVIHLHLVHQPGASDSHQSPDNPDHNGLPWSHNSTWSWNQWYIVLCSWWFMIITNHNGLIRVKLRVALCYIYCILIIVVTMASCSLFTAQGAEMRGTLCNIHSL